MSSWITIALSYQLFLDINRKLLQVRTRFLLLELLVFAIKQVACTKVVVAIIFITVVELPYLSVVIKLLAFNTDRKTGSKHLLVIINRFRPHFLVRSHHSSMFLSSTTSTLDLDGWHEELVH